MVVSILIVVIVGTQFFKNDTQRFYNQRKDIDCADSKVLVELKERCVEALERDRDINIKDEFIYVNFIDGIYTLQIHVLTEEGEYQKFDIMSKEYGIELPYFVYTGKDVGPRHAMKSIEVYEYLKYFADVYVEHGSNTIYLQYSAE